MNLLHSVALEVLEVVLDYVYTARCTILLVIADEIIQVAKSLKMDDFVQMVRHEVDVFTKWKQLKPNIEDSTVEKIEFFGDKGSRSTKLLQYAPFFKFGLFSTHD